MAKLSNIKQLALFVDSILYKYGIATEQLPKSFTATTFLTVYIPANISTNIYDIEAEAKVNFPAIGSVKVTMRADFSTALILTTAKLEQEIKDTDIRAKSNNQYAS
jgi:hypothetical protein